MACKKKAPLIEDPDVYSGQGGAFSTRSGETGGAFYIFLEAEGSATDFVTKAIEHNVLIISGPVFSERNTNFRLSFAVQDETIEKGIEILNSLIRVLLRRTKDTRHRNIHIE